MIKSRLELSGFVVDRLDSARDWASVDVNIENGKKDTKLCHLSDALDFYHPAIGRRNDYSRIRRNLAFRIPEEECYEHGHRQDQSCGRVKPQSKGQGGRHH